jgi:hypothetical protein
MGFAGYVSVCVQLYCVSCHCLTLHVSAYMAIFKGGGYVFVCVSFIVSCHCLTLHVSAYMTIFKCVVYFYFNTSEEICFACVL